MQYSISLIVFVGYPSGSTSWRSNGKTPSHNFHVTCIQGCAPFHDTDNTCFIVDWKCFSKHDRVNFSQITFIGEFTKINLVTMNEFTEFYEKSVTLPRHIICMMGYMSVISQKFDSPSGGQKMKKIHTLLWKMMWIHRPRFKNFRRRNGSNHKAVRNSESKQHDTFNLSWNRMHPKVYPLHLLF